MKATVKNDDQIGRGHALLIIRFDEDDPKPPADEKFAVSVKSHPSGTFLQAPGGQALWVEGAETYFDVKTRSYESNELTLELGPWFTNAFQDNIHFFYLKGSYANYPVLKAETRKVWKPPRGLESIELPDQNAKFAQKPPEDLSTLNRPEKTAPAPEPAPVEVAPIIESPPPPVEEILPPPPSPPPTPAPLEKSENNMASNSDLGRRPPAPPSISGQKTRPSLAGQKSGPTSKTPIFIALGSILLLVIGFLAYRFLGGKETGDASTPPPEVAATETPPAKDAAPVGTPLEQARELLRSNASEADLSAALDRLDGQPGAEDAVFLLARRLAPTSPPRRLRYAAFYDPLDTRPKGTVKPNAKFAFDEYAEAKKAGEEAAASRQEALLEWAKANAKSGDEGALALMELAKKGF
jgi:hypothetical protein